MALVGGGLRATSLHRELAKRRTTRRRGNQQASFDLQIARSSERWAQVSTVKKGFKWHAEKVRGLVKILAKP
jgi:hypothetical protein